MMLQNIIVYNFVWLMFGSLENAAALKQPSSIRPHSTYLPADLSVNTNSSYFIQARKINSEEILLQKNITYNGHGLFVDKLIGDVQPDGGTIWASYGPFHVQTNSPIFNSSELYNIHIQTHIFTKTVQAYSPSLQMLFHLDSEQMNMLGESTLCMHLHILYTKGEILSFCMLSRSTGSCFLDVPIPMSWWLDVSDASYQNSKMQLSYSISMCSGNGNSMRNQSVQTVLEPSVYMGEIPLQPLLGHYVTANDESRVIIKVPENKDVSPSHGFLIPVSIHNDLSADSFSIKIKPRKGLKVRTVHFHDVKLPWEHANSTEEDATIVTYTASATSDSFEAFHSIPSHEVALFLVEFEVLNDTAHSRHISWKIDLTENGESTTTKIATKITLNRGGMLGLIPIAEKSVLLNTAIINHQEVAAGLKVFAIMKDKVVVDVTNQSVCTSTDPTILKVQRNCSRVYLDGSESGSTSDISIKVNFNGKSAVLSQWVWMPELPLIIELSDHTLSLIKGWKVPYRSLRRYRRTPMDANKCRLRYQQATLSVFTRFYTKHANSGRKVYMFSKDVKEDVTSLLTPGQISTSDPQIATVDNLVIYGHSDGIVSIQVLPVTGNKPIAYKEFTVGGDKVEVTDLHVSMVTGMSILSVSDPKGKRVRAVRVRANDQLIAKYQEGVIDVTVGFSDGAILPLHLVSTEDYYIKTLSHNRDIVMERVEDSIRESRVIAIGEGATTINIELQLPRMCHKKHKETNSILSRIYPVNISFADDHIQNQLRRIGGSSKNNGIPGVSSDKGYPVDHGIVHVDFDPSEHTFETKVTSDGKKNGHVIAIPLDHDFFSSPDEPTNKVNDPDDDNKKFEDQFENKNIDSKTSAMEMGMYVMLAVFTLAITVFLINCIIYMYRMRHKKVPPSEIGGDYTSPNESWMWLSRQVDVDSGLKSNQSDSRPDETDLPIAQMYTESEASVEHHTTSCSESSPADSPVESGSTDIGDVDEEEIYIADDPPVVSEQSAVNPDEIVQPNSNEQPNDVVNTTAVEGDPLLRDIQVTINPLSKLDEDDPDEAMEFDQLMKNLQNLQSEIKA